MRGGGYQRLAVKTEARQVLLASGEDLEEAVGRLTAPGWEALPVTLGDGWEAASIGCYWNARMRLLSVSVNVLRHTGGSLVNGPAAPGAASVPAANWYNARMFYIPKGAADAAGLPSGSAYLSPHIIIQGTPQNFNIYQTGYLPVSIYLNTQDAAGWVFYSRGPAMADWAGGSFWGSAVIFAG
jgi:hypothetical protein